MSEQEWLVRLQFLEEAQEYLNTMESALLGLGSQKLSRESIDRILRAAHSIKGGAALMGFEALSQVAHRLEDFFKVLQGGRYEAGNELEQLFLAAVDKMRQMLSLCQQQADISPDWLHGNTQPLLDQLFEQLGNPTAEDEQASLAADAGGDMAVMLFESEIGPCLDRLERVLNAPDLPLLRQEFLIACPEMGSLGEMLELGNFVQLCDHSLMLCQACSKADLVKVCVAVLKSLRRSYGLVLVGQTQVMPNEVSLPPSLGLILDSPAESTASIQHQIDAQATQSITPASSDLQVELQDSLMLEFDDASDFWNDSGNSHTEALSSESGEGILTGPQASRIEAEAITEELEVWDNSLEPSKGLVFNEPLQSGAAASADVDNATDIKLDFNSASAMLEGQANVEAFALDLAIELAEQEPASTEPAEPSITSDFNEPDEQLALEIENLDLDAADAVSTSLDSLDTSILDHLFEGMEPEDFIITTEKEQATEDIVQAPTEEESITATLELGAADAIENLEELTQDLLVSLELDTADRAMLAEERPPAELTPEPISEASTNPALLSELGAAMDQAQMALSSAAIAPQPTSPTTVQTLDNPKAEAAPTNTPNTAVRDSSIRVSVRKLERLGELLGELTTERNGLGLQIGYLHNLFALLNQRVKALDRANSILRQSYDRGATQQLLRHQPQLALSTSPEPLSNSAASGFDLLEMDQYSELHLVSQEIIESVVQIQEVSSDIELALDETETVSRGLNRTAKQLQVGMNQMRMRPLSEITDRFPRLLRELSTIHNKQVELQVRGGGTLIERSIIEALQDPLMHLLRNCFDHGIETPETRLAQGKMPQGNIEISASYRGNQVAISIQDDGAGINLDKIRSKVATMGLSPAEIDASGEKELVNLIFEPGFSTAEKVTDLSGRGVGMDVVRSNLREIQGDISVETRAGEGSTFTLTVPLSLSVTRVLIVECQGMMLAFPANIVEEMLLLEQQKIVVAAEQNLLEWQGYTVPLLNLQDWFHFVRPLTKAETESVPVIDQAAVLIVTHGQEPYAIECDRYWGEQEVTTRTVEGNINLPQGFSGCVVLGDGRVVPLVEMEKLMAWVLHDFQRQTLVHKPLSLPSNISNKQTILVIDDSINVRRFLSITLEKAGYHVEQAKDGQDAIEKLQDGITPDVIMSDVEMPRLDGFGFLAQVKSIENCDAIPVVMLTSRSGEKHRQLAMSLGAADYFSKPFKQNELLQTLATLTEQSSVPSMAALAVV